MVGAGRRIFIRNEREPFPRDNVTQLGLRACMHVHVYSLPCMCVNIFISFVVFCEVYTLAVSVLLTFNIYGGPYKLL